jgi:hypothetical protein
MKFMVLIKATKESEAGALPEEKVLAAMGKFNEELVNAGVLLAGEGLHPSSKGARVRFSKSGQKVIDGPFTETKELLAGFWLFKVASLDEAIAWVKRIPAMDEGAEVEIRQVFDPEDFAAIDPTGEHRAKEAALRARSEGRNK